MTTGGGLPARAVGPRVVTRPQAIAALREALVKLTDREHSLCQVAANNGLFCRGFARFTERGLRRSLARVLEKRTLVRRLEIEEVANVYQLMRQYVSGAALPCDFECTDRELCRGWDEFGNDDLARFHLEILGERVVVVDSAGFDL